MLRERTLCSDVGTRGGPPLPLFGRSVNPIPTGGGQIIPSYYYWPPPPVPATLREESMLSNRNVRTTVERRRTTQKVFFLKLKHDVWKIDILSTRR